MISVCNICVCGLTTGRRAVRSTGTVDRKAPPELTVTQAYQRLTQSINGLQLAFSIEEDNEEVGHCRLLFPHVVYTPSIF